MNSLVEKGCIQEMVCGGNLTYVLRDNSSFLPTEYKVLQNQTDSCFVKCMKMLYNGKVQLYYMTQGFKSFTNMMSYLDADGFMIVVSNLITDIIDVKHNGFLSCQNIDVSFEHIFIDPSTYKVSLVYLPLHQSVYDDNATFENEIRTGLIKMISGVEQISSPQTMQLATDLANGTLRLEDLQQKLKNGKIERPEKKTIVKPEQKTEQKVEQKVIRLVAMNAPSKFELLVTKDKFLIGRNSATVDGVISFNKMIGRTHCQISKHGEQYVIIDLQSSNGTFLNSVKLKPNYPYVIKNGDIIRLANSDFQVNII